MDDEFEICLCEKRKDIDDVEFCIALCIPFCRCLASIGVKNYRRRAFVQPPAVATLQCTRGPLEAPLDWLVRLVWFMRSLGCSLSRKVFVYL